MSVTAVVAVPVPVSMVVIEMTRTIVMGVVDAWREPRTKKPRKQRARKTPREDQGAIKGFIKTRSGVEAYVEPRTLDQGLSVVFVAAALWRFGREEL